MKLYFVFLSLFPATVLCQPKAVVIKTSGTERLVPEGIAVDGRTNTIYITSIHERKIIAVKEDGTQRDFIATAYEGFGRGLGIKVDEKRNLVWAVSNWKEGKKHWSMAHAFDAATGKLRHKFLLTDTAEHLFNDLVIDQQGNAFITATYGHEVYFANSSNGKLSLFLKEKLLQYPNGIELKNGRLFIATYSNGPLVFDLAAKKLNQLIGYINKTYAYNLDGLGFWGNKLYAVYNTDSLNANNTVVAYELDASGDKILSETLVEKGHPLFFEPTTLAVSGGKLYVLANSHLAIYNANGENLKPAEPGLTPVTILVYTLPPNAASR